MTASLEVVCHSICILVSPQAGQKKNMGMKQIKKTLRITQGRSTDLTNGGKPPATADDDGLRMLRDSKFDDDSFSVASLLPLPLA